MGILIEALKILGSLIIIALMGLGLFGLFMDGGEV